MTELAEVDSEIIPRKKPRFSDSSADYCSLQAPCSVVTCNAATPVNNGNSESLSPAIFAPISPPKSPLPPCKYGANCYRKNILHFAQYAHPMKLKEGDLEKVEEVQSQKTDSSDDTDTDIELEEDTQVDMQGVEVNECMEVKEERHDTVFMRGPSILRSYSLLSEDQRRDLIRRAFEMKQDLLKQLSETQKILWDRNKELEKLRQRLEQGHLMVPGEEEALKGESVVYCPLYPERDYKEGSASQIHFRLAESQFYRLLDVKSSFRVTKVEYVVSPSLVQRFQKARSRLKRHRGEESALPVLGFHGTKESNIKLICQEGFKLPGDSGFKHATDSGHYGRGVYFSEYPSYSMAYIREGKKLLLCQVLPGKVYKCDQIIEGEPLQQGFDSHMSPEGKELIIFNSHYILPNYIVHYKESSGDFSYEIDE